MPKLLKISLKILAVIVGLLLLLWLALALYINYNKQSLLKNITAQLNDRVNGELKIGSIDLEVFGSFPNMSVAAKGITVRDTLWQVHKHDLIEAEYLYVDLQVLSLIKGTPTIHQITLKNGSIYLFTDSSDYSNMSALQQKKKKKEKKTPEIQNIQLTNVQFTIENKPKFKYFNFDIRNILAHTDYGVNQWDADADVNTLIKAFCFNTQKGSFVKGKVLTGKLHIHFNEQTKQMDIPEQEIRLSGEAMNTKGTFYFADTPAKFVLEFNSPNVKLSNASSMFTKSIADKVNLVSLDKPASVKALLIGKFKYKDTPWVRVWWNVKDNTLKTPVGNITNTSFTGHFTNQLVRGQTYGDANTAIYVYNMKGSWNDIDYTADTVSVTNLTNPILLAVIHSNFALNKINRLTNNNTFRFNNGDAAIDLRFRGGIKENDTTIPNIKGTVRITKAGITYMPRNISFSNCSGALKFNGSDLGFADIKVRSAKSDLEMNGNIRDFINLLYRTPEKALVDWHIKSNLIDIADFMPFLSKATYTTTTSTEHKTIGKQLARINKLLEQGSAHLDVSINKLAYRKFSASAIKADVLLKQADVYINKLNLTHAQGTIKLKAAVQPAKTNTPFSLQADIAHVNVKELFYSFENFDQDAITDKNITGTFSANADMKGELNSTGKIVPYSLNGQCAFHLTDGALVNFEPIQRIGNIIFRRRDLSNITFSKLQNTLLIQGNKVIIPPMSIESSVLNLFLKGVYSFTTGTDIDMEVPLRNPKKDELLMDDEKENNKRKGIVLYLKATDDDSGKVKIKLNQRKGERIEPQQ